MLDDLLNGINPEAGRSDDAKMTTGIITPADFVNDLTNEAISIVSSCTCQFIYERRPKRLVPAGSGVLLQINGGVYLISAGHVLENIQLLRIPISDNVLAPVEGRIIIEKDASKLPDIAVLKLKDDFAKQLETKYKHLPWDAIEIDHVPKKGSRYLAMGYPESKTRVNPIEENIKVTHFSLLTNLVSAQQYQQLGIDHRTYYLNFYDRKQVQSLYGEKVLEGASPYGISGGGLWYLKIRRNQLTLEISPLLVGILIEYRKKHHVVLSTHIDVITELIRQQFDSSIPRSSSVIVNIK